MVIKLAAYTFLSQNAFLIWEEMLLGEKYKFRKLILETIESSSEPIAKIFQKKIFGILRKIISSLKNQFTHLMKLHLLKVFELYTTIVFFARLMIVRLK